VLRKLITFFQLAGASLLRAYRALVWGGVPSEWGFCLKSTADSLISSWQGACNMQRLEQHHLALVISSQVATLQPASLGCISRRSTMRGIPVLPGHAAQQLLEHAGLAQGRLQLPLRPHARLLLRQEQVAPRSLVVVVRQLISDAVRVVAALQVLVLEVPVGDVDWLKDLAVLSAPATGTIMAWDSSQACIWMA
jgi:hypothetical protein